MASIVRHATHTPSHSHFIVLGILRREEAVDHSRGAIGTHTWQVVRQCNAGKGTDAMIFYLFCHACRNIFAKNMKMQRRFHNSIAERRSARQEDMKGEGPVKFKDSLYVRTSADPVETAKFIFEQVKLQQEVRDRWFGYYLTINAATAALATLLLNLKLPYSLSPAFVASVPVATNTIIGVLFYELYLHQRSNYLSRYKILQMLQDKAIRQIFADDEYEKLYAMKSWFDKRSRVGADYITLQIQAVLTSTYGGLFAALIFIGFGVFDKWWSWALAAWTILLLFFMLQLRRRKGTQ